MEKSQLGQRIKNIRLMKGLTQKEFGMLIDNATKSMVSKWERGEASPNAKRQQILFEIGNQLGVNILETDDSDQLREFIEKEFRHVYAEYLQMQRRELGDRFKRVAENIDKEIVKEESIQHVLSHDLDINTVTNDDVEAILYNYLDEKFQNLIDNYPGYDREILTQIKNEIIRIEEQLTSYYLNDAGQQYDLRGLNIEKYEKMKNILEFTVFQLEKLDD